MKPKIDDFDIPKDPKTMTAIAYGQLPTHHMLIASILVALLLDVVYGWENANQA